jgi:hypothetical protein
MPISCAACRVRCTASLRRPDALPRPFGMHSQSRQLSDRYRVGHVHFHATVLKFMRHSLCGQRVVANHVLLIFADNKTPGGTLPVVLTRSNDQPLGELGRGALKVLQPALVPE